ncbi:MAG: OsmC family protein [Haloechinothrix sp.]
MSEDKARRVLLERLSKGRYRVENVRGGSITVGTGEDDDFTPVELLLAAIGGCSAIDVDFITSKRAEPDSFEVVVGGDKIRDELGNRMENLVLGFAVRFPEGEAGDAARAVLPRAVEQSHDRLCTVSRTVEIATPIAIRIEDAAGAGGTG